MIVAIDRCNSLSTQEAIIDINTHPVLVTVLADAVHLT